MKDPNIPGQAHLKLWYLYIKHNFKGLPGVDLLIYLLSPVRKQNRGN